MNKLSWLKTYSNQSTEELLALEGKYRTDSIIASFQDALNQKIVRDGKGSLSEEELVILAVEALENEVNNNGYAGFFTNYSKEFTPIIVDSLNRINCKEVAELTTQAISSLGIDGPLNIETIERVMNEENKERTEILNSIDNKYYEIAGDLSEPLLEFIKTQRNKIVLHE